MARIFDLQEVASHNKQDDCWVILYGDVYDVTKFLPSHPGGTQTILALAGRDATEEFDPVHPAGTLEEHLSPSCKVGRVLPNESEPTIQSGATETQLPLHAILNLDEMAHLAQKRLSPKSWAYYASATNDMYTKKLNSSVYQHLLLRPRVFVDCTVAETSTAILGHRVKLPFFVAPAAQARLAHATGEHGIAQACARFGAMQLISSYASMTPEQIVADASPGQMFGWQLYVQTQREKSEAMLERISKLRDRIRFVCLTLDVPVPGKREDYERAQFAQGLAANPSASSSDYNQQFADSTAKDLTWATTLPWLARSIDLPIVLKGIQTYEDAILAARAAPQVKAIILSNHGGRAADTASPPIHTLLEIRRHCPDVFDKVEVWIDGGIKRGTDIVKALCLGAKAVGIGRAPLYGLAVGGQAGVERVFEILESEMTTCMRLLGVKTIADLNPKLVNTKLVEQHVYDSEEPPPHRSTASKL